MQAIVNLLVCLQLVAMRSTASAAVLRMPARLTDMTARQLTVAMPQLPSDVSGCAFSVGGPLGDFYVPHRPANATDATRLCERHGAQLAAVDISNFLSVSSGVWDCEGPSKSVSIASWNGDNYGATNMTFVTGPTVGPGAITAILPELESVPLPYLCQWTAPNATSISPS
ncbi:hypothetical protein HKX48_003094 [Thoreauomyces humboldtii]|nr:hypothetical protein HKX48_003094 [Thoreauomyces humboldtii]